MREKTKTQYVLLLEKAEEDLRAVRFLIKEEYYEVAVSCAYYAILYLVTALLRAKGFRVCRQEKIGEARVIKLVESGELNKKFADYFRSAKEKMIRADENLERFSRRQAEIQLRHAEELRLAAWSVLNGERAR